MRFARFRFRLWERMPRHWRDSHGGASMRQAMRIAQAEFSRDIPQQRIGAAFVLNIRCRMPACPCAIWSQNETPIFRLGFAK